MGIYVNPGSEKLEISRASEIYIDKSGILSELNEDFNTEDRFVCVCRPRGFGKSMAADMISAYYDRTVDGRRVFDGLEVLSPGRDNTRMNTCDVVFIDMQKVASDYDQMKELIEALKTDVVRELTSMYPEVNYYNTRDFNRVFADVYASVHRKFVFIIDEWDCVFRGHRHQKKDQEKYLDFLRDWMKDKAYVGLAYMTGILPIKKYGTHSALNMFAEYSMVSAAPPAFCMGFTEAEVRSLCAARDISSDEVQSWYGGYCLKNIGSICNPRSVVRCMISRVFDDYGNQTESPDALRVHLNRNFDGLRDAVLQLMAGARIRVNTRTFAGGMTTFSGFEDVLTLLIHLGCLAYDFDTKEVFIPNREVMMAFSRSVQSQADPPGT